MILELPIWEEVTQRMGGTCDVETMDEWKESLKLPASVQLLKTFSCVSCWQVIESDHLAVTIKTKEEIVIFRIHVECWQGKAPKKERLLSRARDLIRWT